MSIQIGNISKHSMNEVFKNEDAFQAYLAEHLDLLSTLLPVNLSFDKREVMVNRLKLDILATFHTHDSPDTQKAAIEIQLNTSDHKHLGQIITYGIQHDARLCVWIAEEFRPDHVKAMYYQNDIEKDRTFIPVKAEILKIGNSEPALHLSIVQPEMEFAFKGREQKDANTSAIWDFFASIRDEMIRFEWFTRSKVPTEKYYIIESELAKHHEEIVVGYGWRFRKNNTFSIIIGSGRWGKGDGLTSSDLLMLDAIENFYNQQIEIDYTVERETFKNSSNIYLNYSKSVTLEDLENAKFSKELLDWAITTFVKTREACENLLKEFVN